MSKLIRLTPNIKEELKERFSKFLDSPGAKCQDGLLSFQARLSAAEDRKATVLMEPLAWQRMWGLVDYYDCEVAWYGVARRGEDPEKDEYVISDILVYPQTVTGATVDTDDKEYDDWHKALPPEIWNSMAMQGHSHVNMGTSPSGTDTSDQKKILDVLTNDMFYIFLIVNKKRSINAKVYDLEKNILFENKDVTVRLSDPAYDLNAFLHQADRLVKRYVQPVQSSWRDAADDWWNRKYNQSGGYHGAGYQGSCYQGSGYQSSGYSGSASSPGQPAPGTPAPAPAASGQSLPSGGNVPPQAANAGQTAQKPASSAPAAVPVTPVRPQTTQANAPLVVSKPRIAASSLK